MRGKIRAYFVEYNGQYVGIYKTLRGALNLISRKGYKNDYDNTVRLVDDKGNMYNTINGNIL